MVENKREVIEQEAKNIGDLTVSLDLDASDAIKALKAVQREAREATKALRELEVESGKVTKVNELRDLQGTDGNWDVSEYMTGLFNGLELSSATLEGRKPEYRVKPLPDVVEVVSNLYPITYEDAETILEGIEQGRKDRILTALDGSVSE